MAHQRILVLDFGSQYTQLIARRIREQAVYCEIQPYTIATDPELRQVRAFGATGIVLSGGPSSVYEDGAPTIAPGVYDLGVPVLGICYGAQLTAKLLGGVVRPAERREYGRAEVRVRAATGCSRWRRSARSSPCGRRTAIMSMHYRPASSTRQRARTAP